MAKNVECTNFSACLFQKSPTGAMILSEKGDIIQVNDAFSVMLDLENSDTLSRSFHDFLSSDHKKLFISQYKEFFKHPEGKSFELVLEGRKGKKVDVQITGVKTEDNQGNSTIKEALLINATDVTQLRQTQNDLAAKKEELHQLLQRIEQSQETYRNLFQNAQVGLFRTRISDGKILESNEQLAKMFGYDNRKELLSEYITLAKYVDEGTREKMLEMIQEKGFIQNFEARFYRKDKSIFWARYSARIYTDKGWIEGVAEDITEQKKMQRALRESEQRFQKMLSVVPDMISIQSPDMDILYSNWQGFAAVPENKQKVNTKCYKTYRNLDSICPDCLAKSVLETRKPFHKETQLPNGIWYDIRVIPFLDEDNNVEMFMEWVRDITEQKKAEEVLKNNYALLHIAGETSRIGGWDVDLESNVSHWSDVVAEIHELPHGYAPSVQTGINFYAPKWREKITQVYNDCVQKGIPYDEEMEIITSKGKRVWVRTIGKPVKDEYGKVYKLQGSFQDISQRKEMEASLHKSENLFKRVFEILPIGLWVADKNGKLLQGNPAGVKIWGMEPKVDQSEYGIFKAKRLPSREEIAPQDWALGHTVNDGVTIVDELLEIDAFDGKKKIIVNYTAPILNDKGDIEGAIVVNRDITERYQAEETLKSIEWMLSKKTQAEKNDQTPFYGDLSELNTNRLILDAVGKDVLKDIADDFLRLLETSSAIYETNGDYTLGIFASSWCQFMDQASRELCGTNDNKEALHCGKWLCHESCWKKASKVAMETHKPVDIECEGGIHLYALPIIASDEVIGAINFGYGDPPRNEETLNKIAKKYRVPIKELAEKAEEYKSRPPYIIEIAKERLEASANLIGEIVSRKMTEKELLKLNIELEKKIAEKTKDLKERVSELERFHDATIQREFRIKELRDEIEQLKRNAK